MPLKINFPHQARLDSLIADGNQKPDDVAFLITALIETIKQKYQAFVSDFSVALEERDFVKMAVLMDIYREYAKKMEGGNEILGDRTKYYSSILEELPVLLVQKKLGVLIESLGLKSNNLALGGFECVIRIAANPDGSYFHEKKRIDFCLAIDSLGKGHWVPLVGLEVKKYCDKTMFGTILETYKSLQIFRPRTFYGFLVEDEARGEGVILNSPIYKQEFILSGKSRNKATLNPIDPKQLCHFEKELSNALEDALSFLATAGKKGERCRLDVDD